VTSQRRPTAGPELLLDTKKKELVATLSEQCRFPHGTVGVWLVQEFPGDDFSDFFMGGRSVA